MKPLVISIPPELEPILAYLFPTYTIVTDGAPVTRRFIAHKDITSAAQLESLALYYEDCVFISHRLFNELWDRDKVIEKCVEFASKKKLTRKTKLSPSEDNFIQDCVQFIFGNQSEVSGNDITELFDSYGSGQFIHKYLALTVTVPPQKLECAMNTFIYKILNADEASSVYYLRKASVFRDRIKRNYTTALDNYLMREKDMCGLSTVKFYCDLYQN